MKRILSLTLVLCMLVTVCLAFSSCFNKVSMKKVEEDPQATLNDAIQNTGNSFFTDESNAGKVFKEALKCGAFTVSFESEDLMGGDITKIGETVYVDSENKKIVSDTNVTYQDQDLNARIFFDKNGVMLNSEAVFGSQKTYAINFASLAYNLDGSAFAELLASMDVDEEMMASLKEAFTTLKNAMAKADVSEEEAKARVDAYLVALNQTVSEEKIENSKGKETKHVVVAYTLNNQTLKALIDQIAKDTELDAEMKAELESAFEESVAINVSLKLYINAKTNSLTKVTLEGTLTDKGNNETVTVSANLSFSDTEIKLTFRATGMDEPISAEITLTKEDSKDSVVYRLAIDGSQGSVTVHLFNATYTYTKSSGNFALKADVYADENDRTELTVEGNIKVTEKEATMEINKLVTKDATVNFKLIISAKQISEIPAAPTDAKDIVSMTQGEWVDMINEFQQSTVGKLIFGMVN